MFTYSTSPTLYTRRTIFIVNTYLGSTTLLAYSATTTMLADRTSSTFFTTCTYYIMVAYLTPSTLFATCTYSIMLTHSSTNFNTNNFTVALTFVRCTIRHSFITWTKPYFTFFIKSKTFFGWWHIYYSKIFLFSQDKSSLLKKNVVYL